MIKDINFEVIKAIKKANNQIIKLENELVKEYNLTPSQYGVLECLFIKGDMCINDLIERLISTSGNMTVIIKNLEKRNYIRKEINFNDRRFYNIILTKEGKDMVGKIFPEREKQIKDFADTLTNEEKKVFLKLFYKFKKRYKVKK